MIAHVKKILLIIVGWFFVLLGIIGIFTPVMPSIPFFIIASVCFSKSSAKFHHLLLDNKWIGPHIKKYHENHGITIKAKMACLAVQWIGLGCTALLFIRQPLGRLLLLLIGIGVSVYILSLKTAKE